VADQAGRACAAPGPGTREEEPRRRRCVRRETRTTPSCRDLCPFDRSRVVGIPRAQADGTTVRRASGLASEE